MFVFKRQWVVFIVVFLVPLAQASVKSITPNMIELGKIKSGDIAETQIQFVNTSKFPLIIERVKTSCGCTAAHLENDAISPGDTARINITFNSKGFRGQLRKSVSVLLQDHEPPSLNYILDVEVIEELTVSPRYIHYKLNAATFDSLIQGTFVFSNLSDKTVKIKKISTKDNTITWKKVPKEIKPKDKFTFEFDICPKKKLGFSYEQVVIETDFEEKQNVVVPIYVNIKQ